MNIVSYLKPLSLEEKETLLKQKKQLAIAYDENEQWVESFYQRGASVLYARLQISMKFFDEGELDSIQAFLKYVQNFKVKYIIATLPVSLVINKASSEKVNESLNGLIKLLSKYKLKLLIEPSSQAYKDLTYILKAFKPTHLQFVFRPVHIYKTKGSALSLYRIFKSHIQLVASEDITKDQFPALIGYGEADVIALFKLLVKDAYQGDILLEPNFEEYLRKLSKNQDSFWRFFFKKHIQTYEVLKKQMRLTEKKDINIFDIYLNQLDVLIIIFRLG
jgi:hypothetical protein